MAVITVGAAAIDRADSFVQGYTIIDSTTAADGTGTIDTVKVYMNTAETTGAEVAIFRDSGTTQETVDSASIGTLTTGLNTITGLSLAVQTGDYIGIYLPTGRIERAASGGANWYDLGDYIPTAAHVFSAGVRIISLQGTGTTTPTSNIKSVNSVARASIKKINSVAWANVKKVNSVTNT